MKRILIIEDDQLITGIYRNKFSADGFEVANAMDGESGFELIQSFHPDAVILDLMLPKLTGLELLKKIRSQPGLERLPVIVLSNTYLSNLVQEAWKAGATKCLSKADCAPKQVGDVVRSLFPQAPSASSARNQAPDPGSAPDSSASTERSGSDDRPQAEPGQYL